MYKSAIFHVTKKCGKNNFYLEHADVREFVMLYNENIKQNSRGTTSIWSSQES